MAVSLRLIVWLPAMLSLSAVADAQPAADGLNQWGVEISAQANIFAAGQESPPDPGDGSGGMPPVDIRFAAGPANEFQISAAGLTGCCSEAQPWIPPDGATALGDGGTAITGLGPIAGISGSSQMALVGVFLADVADRPPPPALPPFDHRNAIRDMSPAIGQPFFIGDGRTGTGTGDWQRFTAPPTASRLYLGFADAGGFSGSPAAYTDNLGQVTAKISLQVGVGAVLSEGLRFNGQVTGSRTVHSDALSFVGQGDGTLSAIAQTLIFEGQDTAPLNATAPEALVLQGQTDGPVRATAPEALVFDGQADGPVVAQAPDTLRFVGQYAGPRTAQADTLTFVGQGDGTLTAESGRLIFTGQGNETSETEGDETAILPAGSQWQYTFTDPTADPGWNATTEPGWPLGRAPFGSSPGIDPAFEANTDWPPDGADGDDLWLRTSVDLTGYDLSSIRWHLGVDNGYALFVNGAQVSSDNAEGYTSRWEYGGAFPAGTLRPGDNVVALALEDHGGATAFDMQITGQRCVATNMGAGDIASTFAAGTDGWTIFGDAHGLVTDDGGLRVTDDAAGDVWYWSAPASYLGCRDAFYGGTLSFQLRVDRTDAPFDDADVVIVGADGLIWFDTGRNPGTDWTTYTIALSADAGWKTGDGGTPASEAQIRAVLGDIHALHIRGEYRTGDDIGWLAAVSLRAP